MSGKLVAVAIGMLLILVLAGCGSADEQATQTEDLAANPEPTRTLIPTATLTATATPTLPPTSEPSTPTAPTLDPAACSWGSIIDYVAIDSIMHLAWVSHRVIVGEVIEQQPAAWGHAVNPMEPGRRQIYTPYVVRVDQHVRGTPTEMIIIQRLGGEIGNCTQSNESDPALKPGDRLLLFLRETGEFQATIEPSYSIVAGEQGYWRISPDGTVVNNVAHLQQYSGLPLEALIDQIQAALAGPPPTSLWPEMIVPLEETPVPAPTSTASP